MHVRCGMPVTSFISVMKTCKWVGVPAALQTSFAPLGTTHLLITNKSPCPKQTTKVKFNLSPGVRRGLCSSGPFLIVRLSEFQTTSGPPMLLQLEFLTPSPFGLLSPSWAPTLGLSVSRKGPATEPKPSST